MATGIPNISNAPEFNNSIRKLKVELAYECKQEEIDILEQSFVCSEKICTVNPMSHEDVNNSLYFGDNLDVLLELRNNEDVCGKVKLIYIDPPYATKSTFKSRNQNHAYSDILSGGQYLEFLRKRLIILRELLASDGSIYVHLDDNMAFQAKVLMDEIFGENNFRNFIVRKKCSNKNYTKNTYGNVADYILFYSKSNKYVWNRPYQEWDEENIIKQYPCVDENGRRYKKVPIHAPGERNGETGKEWRGILPPKGKHWQYIPRKLDEFDAKGEMYWSSNGNPRRKVFFDGSDGVALQDIWMNYRDSINQNTKTTGYPTEKNIDMIKQIIQASSNEEDIVLDCFCGSGTTMDAAFQLNRKWIGIDNSIEAINAVLIRFLDGLTLHGDYVKNTSNNIKQLTIDALDGKCGFHICCTKDYLGKSNDILDKITEYTNA